MILGFAHITENSADQSGDWIPNPPEKWPLMVRPARQHVIALKWKTGRDADDRVVGAPLEIVRYDTELAEQNGRIGFGARVDDVWLCARDEEAELAFYRGGVGFKDAGRHEFLGHPRLCLSSSVRDWGVAITSFVNVDAPIDPPLDIAGYAALAFYSSDVEADRDHLLKHGGRTPTEPFTVKLDREMKIVMLRSPEGTIIELIQVLP